MRKLIKFGILLVIACLSLARPLAFAEEQGHTPPGWSHGKKTGWHGGHRPPGLAKKEGAGKKEKKYYHKNYKKKKHHEEHEEHEEKEAKEE